MGRRPPKRKEIYTLLKTPKDDAAALYDGGWRPDDRSELAATYGLTPEEADELYPYLVELDEQNHE